MLYLHGSDIGGLTKPSKIGKGSGEHSIIDLLLLGQGISLGAASKRPLHMCYTEPGRQHCIIGLKMVGVFNFPVALE